GVKIGVDGGEGEVKSIISTSLCCERGVDILGQKSLLLLLLKELLTMEPEFFTVYKDYYGILGLQKNVNKSDIKKAYYMLAKKNHPDTNKDPTAKELFVMIQEAYDVLSDDQKRIQYDQLGVLYNGKRSPSSGVRFNVENIGGFSGGYDEENFNNIFGERLAGSKINT
ncbi:2743_t:CDS:2, partial [Entrophospora sp. SA101]